VYVARYGACRTAGSAANHFRVYERALFVVGAVIEAVEGLGVGLGLGVGAGEAGVGLASVDELASDGGLGSNGGLGLVEGDSSGVGAALGLWKGLSLSAGSPFASGEDGEPMDWTCADPAANVNATDKPTTRALAHERVRRAG
jgi:hypothetical protein